MHAGLVLVQAVISSIPSDSGGAGSEEWVRPKLGESCWLDVGLQLVDEAGQLSKNASVRARSESRRTRAAMERITDGSSTAGTQLLSSTDYIRLSRPTKSASSSETTINSQR